MQKEMIDLFNKNTEAVMEAAKKLGELNMRTLDRVIAQQNEIIGLYMDFAGRSMDLMAHAKGMQELANGQVELGRELSERGVEVLRKSAELANETGNEYGAMVQEGVKAAQEQLTKASATAFKAAA